MHSNRQIVDYNTYRCAVALSNMGVSLLERRSYSEAVDTFKDAVAVMKGTFNKNIKHQNMNGEYFLEQAYRRTAAPRSAPGKSFVEILSSTGLTSTVTSIMHRHGRDQFPPCFPIRIENFQTEERNVDLDSSIILHNFATGYLCLSRVAPSRCQAHYCRAAALKLAKLAHLTLSDMIKACSKQELDSTLLGDCNLVLIAASVLNTIVRIQLECGKITEAGESYQRLRMLGTVVSDSTGRNGGLDEDAAAAAA